ncbi:hypothetical protein Tco_0697533, partial [Tanacetum coccineum]
MLAISSALLMCSTTLSVELLEKEILRQEVGYVRFDNQSIERDRLIGIGFVLDFMEIISFTFGDKEMISVIEAIGAEFRAVLFGRYLND